MHKPMLIIAALIASMTATAFAHSPLKSTMPANMEVVQTQSKRIELRFAKPARLTKVTLERSVDGVTSDERLALPDKTFSEEFSLSPSLFGRGEYKVNWRALGKDGHALKGAFSYTVTGE